MILRQMLNIGNFYAFPMKVAWKALMGTRKGIILFNRFDKQLLEYYGGLMVLTRDQLANMDTDIFHKECGKVFHVTTYLMTPYKGPNTDQRYCGYFIMNDLPLVLHKFVEEVEVLKEDVDNVEVPE